MSTDPRTDTICTIDHGTLHQSTLLAVLTCIVPEEEFRFDTSALRFKGSAYCIPRLYDTMASKKGKFYAVAVGRKVGIYKSWSECEAQVRTLVSVAGANEPSIYSNVSHIHHTS
jgi:hypothetical protein